MGNLKIIDKMSRFVKGNQGAMDRALNRMAIDILNLSDLQVPIGQPGGHLRASHTILRFGLMQYTVQYNKRYAAFQEFGGDGFRTVKHYTYAGRKAHFLRDPGNTIKRKAMDYLRAEAKSIKI